MRRAVLPVVLALLLGSACSLGPRQEWAELVRATAEEATAMHTAKVRMAVDVEVIETNIRETPTPLIARLEGVVDFRARRASLVGPAPARPTIYFDDLVVLLPRSETSIGESGKRWVRFEFEREPSEDVDDTDRRLAVGAGMISPALVPELLEGVLAGSMERAGTERVTGVETTHYRARMSPDAAAREMDDEGRREGMLRIFETLGVQEEVFPAEVWLDDRGLLRRAILVLRQQKDRVNAFEMRLVWEFYDYDAALDLELPPSSDTIRAPRFREFIVEYIRESGL